MACNGILDIWCSRSRGTCLCIRATDLRGLIPRSQKVRSLASPLQVGHRRDATPRSGVPPLRVPSQGHCAAHRRAVPHQPLLLRRTRNRCQSQAPDRQLHPPLHLQCEYVHGGRFHRPPDPVRELLRRRSHQYRGGKRHGWCDYSAAEQHCKRHSRKRECRHQLRVGPGPDALRRNGVCGRQLLRGRQDADQQLAHLHRHSRPGEHSYVVENENVLFYVFETISFAPCSQESSGFLFHPPFVYK